MTVEEALKEARGKADRIDAMVLMEFALRQTKEFIFAHGEYELTDTEYLRYNDYLRARQNHVPVAYIVNNKEFMGIDFYVDENVLIPRPDTEILAQTAIEMCTSETRVLDMCTGSGCIAVSVASYVSGANVTAVDVGEKALRIAKKNADSAKVSGQVTFKLSNLFDNLDSAVKFDMIISNPPYIRSEEIDTLSPDIMRHEPRLALDGGLDGLDFYRAIAEQSRRFLSKGGVLLFEIGYDQKDAVTHIMEKNGYKDIFAKKDLSGNYRVLGGSKCLTD